MQKYECLVCGQEMKPTYKILYEDHVCNGLKDLTMDHQLTLRIVHDEWMDGSIKMRTPRLAKLRVAFYKERLFLKVHYDDKYTEVWGKNNSPDRIRINQIVSPDFANIDKLKTKIKTMLVFG